MTKQTRKWGWTLALPLVALMGCTGDDLSHLGLRYVDEVRRVRQVEPFAPTHEQQRDADPADETPKPKPHGDLTAILDRWKELGTKIGNLEGQTGALAPEVKRDLERELSSLAELVGDLERRQGVTERQVQMLTERLANLERRLDAEAEARKRATPVVLPAAATAVPSATPVAVVVNATTTAVSPPAQLPAPGVGQAVRTLVPFPCGASQVWLVPIQGGQCKCPRCGVLFFVQPQVSTQPHPVAL
jgi:hypothetical protein